MAQRVKQVPFLETSQEISRQWRGDGCSSTACPTTTGNPLPALLLPAPASLLPTETQSKLPWDAMLEMRAKKKFEENSDWEWEGLPDVSRRFYREVYAKEWAKESVTNCECGLVAANDCSCNVSQPSGECGEIDFDQLMFWKDRRDVPMK
jgi:hypothetical protein